MDGHLPLLLSPNADAQMHHILKLGQNSAVQGHSLPKNKELKPGTSIAAHTEVVEAAVRKNVTVRDHSLPRYVKLTDMVLENDAGEFWILKDSGILRKAVSADDERVMIDRAAMDLILEEYEIEEREFSILFGGYEKLPGFGGNGNLVYVDYAGQEERLEIPYENSDAYITVMILKWI